MASIPLSLSSGVRAAWPWLAGYAALWLASVGYLAASGGDWTFPLVSMGVFGLGGSAAVWALTRRSNAPAVPVARPALELAAVLLYLLLYALVFLGPVMGWLRAALPPGQGHELLVLAGKLVAHVVLPALLAALGARLRPLFDTGLGRPGFWPVLILVGGALIALLAVVSPSLKDIAATGAGWPTLLWAGPAGFAMIALVAGLNEEFLYRAVLQSRLAAVLGSGLAAVPVASVLFALAHWPGLYLRGGPGVDGWSPDPVAVAAFTIATLSPLSLMLGTAWARTRSLLLVVLLHAAVDFLPSLGDFIRVWA